MATELEALQLNITGSVRSAEDSIDRLIGSLTRLGDKLGVLSNIEQYNKPIEDIAKSFDVLGESINKLDNDKFRNLNSSLKSFIRSCEKLSNFKGFSNVEANMNGVSAAVKKVSDEFSEEFGVTGTKGTQALTQAIQAMYSEIEQGNTPTRESFSNIQNLVKEFSNLHQSMQPVISDWQKVRDWISNSNIALPDMTGEWGDDYKKKRAVLGIKNTSTQGARDKDFATQIAEMNSALGTSFDVSKSEQDILNDIVEYIEKGKDSASNLAQEFWNAKENANGLKDAAYGLVANLEEIAENAQTLNANFSNIQTSPFDNIVNGLESISHIDLPDFSNISTLANALTKIGGETGTRAAQNLKPIAEGIKFFSGVSVPQLAGITEFANGLRSLGSKNVAVAANSLKPLGEALRNFPTSIPAVSGINELGQALSVFGRKTAVQAVETIPKLATAFRQLIKELSAAPTVSRSVIDLANALAKFVSNVNNVSTSSTRASKGLNLFGITANRTAKSTFSLASAIGKIYATYFLLFRAIGKIRDSIDIASSLKEVQNVVDTTFGDMTDKVEEFASTSIRDFGMSELSVKQYASRFQAMGVAMGISAKSVEKAQKQLNTINPVLAERGYSDTANSIADISLNITKLAADMSSFYNVAQEDVAKDLESIFTGMTRPLRQYGLDLTEATIKEWALKNGLDANIKTMSQAEKTLLRYQYVLANTSASQGDFSKTSVTWANQIRMLGQNFERLGQVIGSGFIAWLRPAVVAMNNAMDSIIAAVQRVVNALGQIFGWQMIVDTTGQSLIDDTEGVADAWDDATGAAKNYKQQLLGIDELNNLTTKDGGSGSGDSDLLGGISGGNIVEPGGIRFEKYESDIKSLFDLGKTISEGLANLLPDSWNEIYEKARGFGTGIADFLNGLIQPETFRKLGQSLAGILNTIKEAFIAFIRNANWKQYKDAFVAGLEGFFGEIEISTVALVIGTITITKVGKWILGGASITAFSKALSSLFASSGSAGGSTGLSALFASIGTAGAVAIAVVASVVAGLGIIYATNEEVRKSFSESIETIKNSLSPALEFIGNTVIPNIVTGFHGLFEIIKPIGDFLETVFVSLWQDMINPALKDIGENILPPLSKAFEHLWTGVIVPLADIIGGVLNPVISTVAGIMTDLWKNVVVPLAQGFSGILSSAIQLVIGLFNDVVVILTPVIKIIQILWNATLKPLAEWLLGTFKDVINSLFLFIGGVIKGITNILSGVIDFITGVFTLDWEKAWNGVGKIFEGVFYALGSIINTVINLLIDGINFFLEGINWATSGISELTGKDLSIKKIEHLKLEGFANGGFPNQGSLFVAGETYGQTEWIGNINGRTGVTSGSEITGIADAIYITSNQEMELLRQQNQYLLGILNKEFGITRNQIGREAQAYAKEYQARTGNYAYQA